MNYKPIRLIECFAGYGSQALALKYLGIPFEHHRIAEWAVKSIQAYKDMHFPDDNTDYSCGLNFDNVIDYLFERGISADYNKPMTREQIKRMGESKCRTVYNNITATHNLVSVCNVTAKDLQITDTDNFTYLLTYSFPCQDLSSAGLSKGMAKGSGTRSGLLWEIERILKECDELPQVLLMENVPEVIGQKNKDSFGDWIAFLDSMGYKSKREILNGTDFEIPQNRKRCFMVSVLGDYYYDFPQKLGCTLRLKDLLEKNVSEEYYLSNKALIGCFNTKFETAKIYNQIEKDGVLPTILARDYKDPKLVIEPKCEQVAQLEGGNYNEMTGRVYGTNGASPTVRTFCGGGQEIKVLEDNSIKMFQYPRGANKGGVRDVEVCPTITTCSWENNCMLVEPLALNDTDHLRVFDAYHGREIDNSKCGTICTNSGYRQAGVFWVQNSDMRVRKLTPRECFRLMGVKDEDYERVAHNQSKSSLYHCAGDSIVVNVLMAIFKELFM